MVSTVPLLRRIPLKLAEVVFSARLYISLDASFPILKE
jgi:hypothetical protein